MLSDEMLSNKESITKLLQQPVVVIKNALKPEIAEQLYEELLNSQAWEHHNAENTWKKINEDVDGFSYERDNIEMGCKNAPLILNNLYEYLMDAKTRRWFSEISGRQCDSFIGASTIFNKGDHITEHNDRYVYENPGQPRYARALTFNYYLSKNWDSEWGGNLVWRDPYSKISPTFNTLVLFNVTNNSHHWVEAVNRDTETKRLSVTGWYLTEIQEEKFKLSI